MENFLLGLNLDDSASEVLVAAARQPTNCGSDPEKREELGQWFTPAWAAELLYDAYFSHLGVKDCVWEPTAGAGGFLAAIPSHVKALGTDIDPEIARVAEALTGRKVIVGDCCTVPLPEDEITAVIGNIPFELSLLDRLLDRCRFLPQGAKCGLLLPDYMFQTYGNVIRWNEDYSYSIEKDSIPRGLFPGITKPLNFTIFTRDARPQLIGFRLYKELSDIRKLPAETQELLSKPGEPRGLWARACIAALKRIGGHGTPSEIARALEQNRPYPGNPWWKEQIRKVLRQHFPSDGNGVYSLPGNVAAAA